MYHQQQQNFPNISLILVTEKGTVAWRIVHVYQKCNINENICYRLLVSLDLQVMFADLMSLITVGGSLPDTDIAYTPGLKF